MLSKTDLETLATLRLEDAQFLFSGQRYSAAYYLSGYAIELAIKACIAKVFQPNTIPDKNFVGSIYTHNLQSLIGVAGLAKELNDDASANPPLAVAWGIASKWTEASRYSMWDTFAAASILKAVDDPQNGVFQWVKKHW